MSTIVGSTYKANYAPAVVERYLGRFENQRAKRGKWVTVRYGVNSSRALAEVEDQGAGFDPSQVPDPTASDSLELPSGRELLLISNFVTWVRFNEYGNCVTMCRFRSGKGDE